MLRREHAGLKKNETPMKNIGVFGHLMVPAAPGREPAVEEIKGRSQVAAEAGMARAPAPAAADESAPAFQLKKESAGRLGDKESQAGAPEDLVQPGVRTEFADTAFWSGSITTDAQGKAAVEFQMPENLTGWKVNVWAMGHGTRVGEGHADVVTRKDLIVRLQAPRFFVETDEVVLSANVHNYLKNRKSAKVVLELDGGCLVLGRDQQQTRSVLIDANGEKRVDWRVKVLKEGEALVRMKALTDEESDAMQMRFPVYVHGMVKQVPKTGVIRADQNQAQIKLSVPAARRVKQAGEVDQGVVLDMALSQAERDDGFRLNTDGLAEPALDMLLSPEGGTLRHALIADMLRFCVNPHFHEGRRRLGLCL